MSEPVEEMPASEQETQVSEPAGPIGPGKSIEDMKQNMDLINAEIKLIRNETMLFNRLLSRVSEKKTEVDEQTRPESRKSRKSKLVKLNEIQKLEIAQKEYDLIREENRKIIGDYEKQIEIIRNISEEFELREMSMRKFLYEFDREVINAKKKQGQQNSNKKQAAIYSAEKYEKFSENKIKEKDKLLENLRNKNTKLAEMNRIYCHQLKQMEERGDELHEVNFHCLKIENKQVVEGIEIKNAEFKILKVRSGIAERQLNHYKERITAAVQDSERLNPAIEQRNSQIKNINAEIINVENEKANALEVNEKLKAQQNDFIVPTVFEYVQQTASTQELKKTVNEWQRKVDILEMASKSYRKQWENIIIGIQRDNMSQNSKITTVYQTTI
jgi:hypothetical protein